jgi:APA family basic amino acid/polyamine antiporter
MPNPTALRRELNFPAALSLVVGTMIGTGIFLKTALITQLTGSPLLVLAAWAVAGAMSLVGALVYAELGELFPHAGGEYVYLKSGYGSWLGFLYGWQRFWIGSPASVAAYAVGSTLFLRGAMALSPGVAAVLPVVIIAVFTALNCFAVKVGGGAQAALTALKLLLVLGLTAAILGLSRNGTWAHLSGSAPEPVTAARFGLAVLAALWAFDGWNNLPMAAGEVKDSARNVPLALIAGVITVFAAYALANLAYFYALPVSEILGASSPSHRDALPVATLAARTVFGEAAVAILAIAMVISAWGALNGSILTGARIPYALAVDGLFPRALAGLSKGGAVPATAVMIQGAWAAVLALSGSFDQLTDLVVFASWIFYALCAFSVIRFRRQLPLKPRSYRVPFYPVLPLAFCALALCLLVNTLVNQPKESALGLVFILAGVPVYFWRVRMNKA